MKANAAWNILAIMSLTLGIAGAQVALPVTPTTPTKFETRGLGETTQGGVTAHVSPTGQPAAPVVKQIAHFSLSEPRQWTDSKGQSLLGSIIAFEDSVIVLKSASDTVAPPLPEHPTVVRGGKVRLLVNGKAYEMPLDRLSEGDQKFVESLQAAITQRSGAAAPSAPAPTPPSTFSKG